MIWNRTLLLLKLKSLFVVMSLFTFHGYTLIQYIQRGEMHNQRVCFFFTLFQFWLKFGCSRLSLTIGVTDLSCATSIFDQSRRLWFRSSAKDVSAWCKYRSSIKPEDILDRITFNGMQETNQALKSKLVLYIPLFFLFMVTDHPCTPQHLMIR